MTSDRIHRLAVFAATLTLVASVASTTAVTAASGPKKDFVAGGGVHVDTGIFNVSAHRDGTDAGPAKGSLTLKVRGTEQMMKADVSCLAVYSSTNGYKVAYVTGLMSRPYYPAFQQAGDLVVFRVDEYPSGEQHVRFAWGSAIWSLGIDGCFGTYEGPEIQKGHVVINDAQ